MRQMTYCAATVLAITLPCTAKDKLTLAVRAVSNQSQTYERTMNYTTPGTSNTNCSGSATTIGNTTNGNANCQTQSTPPQTHQVTATTWDVTNVVEGNGMRYVITCTGGWVGSNCGPLSEGQLFHAEIDGTTMWIEARRGGNQGKKINIKYKILDIRPVKVLAVAATTTPTRTLPTPPPPEVPPTPAPTQNTRAESEEPVNNAEIISMTRSGLSTGTLIAVIAVRPANFSVAPSDLAVLRATGVPDPVIQAMVDKAGTH